MCYKSHHEYYEGFKCVRNFAKNITNALNMLKILPWILPSL